MHIQEETDFISEMKFKRLKKILMLEKTHIKYKNNRHFSCYV